MLHIFGYHSEEVRMNPTEIVANALSYPSFRRNSGCWALEILSEECR